MKSNIGLSILLLLPVSACTEQPDDVATCTQLTIAKAGLSNQAEIVNQRQRCLSDPVFEICIYEGISEYRKSGTLPPNEHMARLEQNCTARSVAARR